ncbi:radical SAM protein [Corynebacterium freiburgense]|uniref:radical SAM protein n=1 Tax=Corynebacterium freiburgense TaxID=556548 RepID=UPI00040809B8|nr:radical SAM protein [Corynebacterium freiburgense]WJZ03422.1 Antilisterial bacteriocin subtilosin biosynthesis protein AlbA [Corynebacterium freiburgense]
MQIALKPARELKIFSTANGNTIAFKKLNQQGQEIWDGFDVNDTAVLLLKHLEKCQSSQEFVHSFCNEHHLDELKCRHWIENFIATMVSSSVIHVTDLTQADSKPVVSIPVLESASPSTPRSVIIEITNTCNESCAHCYLSAGPKRNDRVTLESFRRLCKTMSAEHVYRIQLTGGEVFMHPKFPEMLEIAFAEFSEVGVLTNGTILTDRVLHQLVEHKDRVTVSISLDSVKPETHNKLRNHRKAYEKTVANIRKLTEAGIFVRITAVLFDDNLWELDAMAKQAHELGAKMFSFNFIESYGRGKDLLVEQQIQEGIEYANYIEKTVEKYRDIIPVFQEEERSEEAVRNHCGAGTHSVVISASGDLRPCNLFPETFAFGNALERNWTDLFSSAIALKLHDITAPSEHSGCANNCEHKQYCKGCLLHALSINAERDDKQYCQWVRKQDAAELVEHYKKSV